SESLNTQPGEAIALACSFPYTPELEHSPTHPGELIFCKQKRGQTMHQHPPLSTIPPCPQCGGKRVGGLINTMDSRVRFETLQDRSAAKFRVLVCTACGFTALYADTEELAQALQKHPKEFLY